MALSGSTSIAATSQDTLRFSWSATQNVANNTSTISWKMELIAASAGYIASTASKSWSVVVNGTSYSGTNTVGISNNSTKTLASGTTTVSHNADGTKSFSYSFSQQFSISWGSTSVGTKSGSGTGVLNAIPRAATITSAPNFTDEENPVIKYNNNLGNSVTSLQAAILSADGATTYAAYRDITKTGMEYTFSLTTTERNALRAATPNSKTMAVRFYIKTVMSGNTYTSYIDKTITIVNAAPTINPVLSIPTTSDTYKVTGSTSKFIKNYTWVSYAFNAAGAKSATIKSYRVTCGELVGTSASGRLDGAMQTATVVFTVTDSRGYTTTQTVNANLVDYVPLTCNSNVDITPSGVISGTISGNYFNSSFGSVSNTITVQYRYKKTTESSYSSWRTLTAVKSGNTYSCTVNLTGLDYNSKYHFQAQAVDKLATISSNILTLSCIPVFDWSEDDFNFNVPITYTDNSGVYNLSALAKALTTEYSASVTVTRGTNYAATSGNATLIGNQLRCFLSAERSSNIAAGNITNELVAKFTVNHGGKIKKAYTINFANGATGGTATFNLTNVVSNATTITFEVNLAANTAEGKFFESYFVIPCLLNLDNY